MKKDIFSNSFEDAYKEFQNSQLSAKLATKFQPKPFYKKFRKLKILSNVGSILFAGLSALTAFSFVFIICLSMEVGLYPALILSGVALSALEYTKRLILEPVALDFLKFRKFRLFLALVFVGMSTISVYSSFQGSKLAINELNSQVVLIDRDSVINRHEAKIKATDDKITTYQTDKKYQTSDGIIFYDVSTKLIPQLEEEKSRQEAGLTAAIDATDLENKNRSKMHRANNDRKGVNLGYVTILCECLLLLCLGFSNYYDYRSFVEMVAVENTVYTASSESSPSNEVIQLATRKIDADISSYQHKIKNKVGKPETAQKRIAELTAKKQEILSLNNS